MPQAVATWVFSTVYLVTVGTAAAYTAAALAYVATVVVISSALAAVSKSLMPTPKGLRSITTEYGGTVEPRRIIYGEVRVSGMNVIPPIVTGAKGQYLHQVLALAGHPVSGIDSVWFDQTEITDGMIGAVTSSENDGLVASGTYVGCAWIRRYTGAPWYSDPLQTAQDWILDSAITSEWTSSHKGQGIPYLALQYEFKKKIYTNGKPDVSCLVQGKKVYDPRKDDTEGGSGAHRHTDNLAVSPVIIAADTWEYSTNPALCLADYLMDSDLGLGEDPARIDWTTVAVAANECDEVVQVPTGASPEATTQYRYRCNIALSATDRYEDNIEAICTTMLGHCYYSAGQWQIYAGAWSSSAFDLTENDVIGAVSIQADTPRAQKFNAVRGQYYDALRNYQPSEFQPRTDAAYEAADGERIWREVDLRGCTNEYEAQRNAIYVLRGSRNRRTVTADFSMAAFKVRPYETGTLTIAEIGWSEMPVRCVGWEFRPEGSVRLTLQEESSTDWSDPAISDYTYVAGASAPVPGGYIPPQPTSLTLTAVTSGVLLSWECDELPQGAYFEIVRQETGTLGSPITVFSTTYGNTYVDAGLDGKDYYYWVRAVSGSGTPGDFYPTGTGATSYRIIERLVPDPHFELSATSGDFWALSGDVGAMSAAISATGGVAGGILSVTFPASQSVQVKVAPVKQKTQAVTGQYVEGTIRWRRTGTIASGTDVQMAIYIGLASSITDYLPSGTYIGSMADVDSGPIVDLIYGGFNADAGTADSYFNTYTVNEWQETNWRFRLKNYPKSTTQRPYLFFYLYFNATSNASNAGTIEIDTFNLDLIAGAESSILV